MSGGLPRDLVGPLGDLDRRGFLHLTGLVAATGLLPAGCRRLPAALQPPAGLPLKMLTPRSYATFTAAAHRLVGPAAEEVTLASGLDLGALTDEWLSRAPGVGRSMHRALLFVEFAIPPLLPKWRPFTALDGPSRDRVLEALRDSRLPALRSIHKGIRSFAVLAFHLHPESWPLTGYPGPFGNDAVTIADAMTE